MNAMAGSGAPEPLAVTEGAAQPRIALCNMAATLAGVRPGMALAAAWAVAPGLKIKPRDAQAEQAALERLAGWAGRYTPEVSLHPPDGLLLQIAQSLSLFGGLEALLQQVRHELDALGYLALHAAAPTPHGAWLLARAGLELAVADAQELARHLSALPVALLDQPRATLGLLEKIGAATLGDCRKLPRAGLARRAGRGLLDELDRAFGHQPDPRRFFTPPPRYAAQLELPFDVENAPALLFAARRLLTELAGFLAGRSAGVQRLALTLRHRDAAPTSLTWGLIAPSRDLEHLTDLLRERLDRLQLAAPVHTIALETLELSTLAGASVHLFEGGSDGEHRWRLLERLQERLGRDAVAGLALHADHRPERAWCVREPAGKIPPPPLLRPGLAQALSRGEAEPPIDKPATQPVSPLIRGARGVGTASEGSTPTWLLPEPQALPLAEGIPQWQGPLALLAGPERIEAGWWDEAPAARDYYLAQTPGSSRVWIYRVQDQWFLHGLFA